MYEYDTKYVLDYVFVVANTSYLTICLDLSEIDSEYLLSIYEEFINHAHYNWSSWPSS